MTPTLLRVDILKRFGRERLDEDIVVNSEKQGFALKSCGRIPAGIAFDSKPISHRFLPVRFVDFGVLHKQLHGSPTTFKRWHQDEASVFCKPSQVEEELSQISLFTAKILRNFKLDVVFQVVNNQYFGKIVEGLKKLDVKYEIDADSSGETILKCYTKLDNGEYWSGASVKLDETTPKVMDLSYNEGNAVKTTPILISHSAIGPFDDFLKLKL
ncbi:unnamed protein product [Bursaphelenchus okinawaensis]|uniref:Uncharacterized protein n=1 Tax=Bursaphelenchus okinawaensis TaxID=465554 RepID=A0A811LMM8_9BILA|nr:unnamed protein product [Bursaphelenchus okinawaensis]CAG9125256.1 unnamed protein product [Bursaphelenchus okinawaensis]